MIRASLRCASTTASSTAGQPSRQAGLTAKILQMREGADIGLLDHILGFAVVAQDAAGDPVEPTIIPLHDSTERRAVAGERAAHELRILGVGGSLRGWS